MLHGRQPQLDALKHAFQGALGGQPVCRALAGEPGIGKTRLAHELAQWASAQGFTVAWARAWEAGGGPALWPWQHLFDELRVARPQTPVPAWRHHAQSEFAASDPTQARAQLFDSVAADLRALSTDAPLLCIFDDVHAADLASLELLGFLLGTMHAGRLGWLLTYRDAEAEQAPVRGPLQRVLREATVLPLGRLSRVDSQALLTETLRDLEPGDADSVFQATAGNPLFLVEAARSLTLLQHRPATLERLALSHGVSAVMESRLALLDAAGRELVEAASVIGGQSDAAQLAQAAGLTLREVRERAEKIVSAGLFNALGADRWRFTHALLRDAIYRRLEPPRRRALHRTIALNELTSASAKAHHGLCALPDVAALEVARWVIAAATVQRGQCAYDDAVALLLRARDELAGAAAEVDGELGVALGWAQGDQGDAAAMRQSFRAVMQLARRTGDHALFARAVIGYGARYLLGDVRTDLLGLLDEAMGALKDSDAGLVARLQARRAAAMTPAAVAEDALALARAALAKAAQVGDAPTSLDVAVAAGSAMGDHAPPLERIVVNRELVRLSRTFDDRVLQLRGLGRLVTDHLEAGDVAQADAVLLDWVAVSRSLALPRFRWMEPLFHSMRAMPEGRFNVCDAALEEARSLAAQAGDENARRCLAVHAVWLALLRDDAQRLVALEAEALAALASTPEVANLVRVAVGARSGQLAAARAALSTGVPLTLPGLQATNSLATLADAALACDAREHARAVQPLLERRAVCNAVWGLYGLTCGPPVAATLGALALKLGDAGAARAHFEAALGRTVAMKAPAHRVWVLRASGRHDEAAELARALGMGGLVAPAPRLEFSLEACEGGFKIRRGDRALLVPGLRGMQLLSRLVQAPGDEIHCLELVSGAAADGELADAGDAGAMLDEASIKAYRRRARELSARIDEAEEVGDAGRAEAARTELEALGRELSRGVGLGGKARRAGSSAERARTVAQRRIKDAIARIKELDSELGAHLAVAVRTGTFCSYEPKRRAR